MTFGALEIAAFVLIVLGLTKILIVSFNPKKWMGVIKFLYSRPLTLFIIEFALAAILFYYLIQQFTIVQIMAVIALGALLTGMVFSLYSKETLDWASRLLRGKTLLKKAWIPIIIWLALILWTLLELFR